MAKALLLIDIQNDYFPGGNMELSGSETAGKNAGILLQAFREKKLPIIHIQHLFTRAGATFFVPGTKGIDIHQSVLPAQAEPVFTKNFPNSFRETGLLAHLKTLQATELVIAGMMTHMCVDTTVRAACDLGFTCQLAYDACATKDLVFNEKKVAAANVQTAYMAALNGLFATVLSTGQRIDTL